MFPRNVANEWQIDLDHGDNKHLQVKGTRPLNILPAKLIHRDGYYGREDVKVLIDQV